MNKKDQLLRKIIELTQCDEKKELTFFRVAMALNMLDREKQYSFRERPAILGEIVGLWRDKNLHLYEDTICDFVYINTRGNVATLDDQSEKTIGALHSLLCTND